jgi:serine/threonine protein kinase, bacterial
MLENQAMIDRLLGGRYRIVTTLGSGGFSQTYVAEDTHRPGNPKCAVKHLQPANSNQNFLQSARRLFQSEAETLEKLGHHDRIPRLLAYFEENQEFYLVQEFVQGELLTDKLLPNQRWTENQVWEFIQEILEILVFIHGQGFIHRDIKPSNIIQRQEDNKLVLVDFGSVKQNWTQLLSLTANIQTPATVGIGTPGYMPMEQARGRPRPNSDIYALGAIAVQALTGLYPMQLEEDFETGELLWRQKAQVSEALAVIITKMVRYHFKDRYENATDALAEVQRLAPFYLPTEISLEQLTLPNLSPEPQIALVNQPTQHTSSTVVTIPTLPKSETARIDLPEMLAGNSALPNTTIFSPLKPQPLASNRRPYLLTIGATIGAALIALGAGYAIYWQPRLKFEQTLEQLENLRATGKYSECMMRAATIPQNSSLYADAQNVLFECKLIEAKRLATNADFTAAIALISSLPQNTTAYSKAQPLIAQWSNSILALATSNYQAGKLNEAISIAKVISPTNPVYQKAQAKIKQWQAALAKNNSYSAATVKLVSNQTKSTTAVTKKVVKKSPVISKPTTTASKPKLYSTTSTTRVVRKSSPTYKHTTTSKPRTYTKQASAPTKRTTRSKSASTSSRMAKSTSSSRKYLKISKKVVPYPQVKSRTKKVVKRVTLKVKKSYSRHKSYRWTTKTVR